MKEAIGLGDQLVPSPTRGLDRSHEQLKMAYRINALAAALKAAYAEIDRLEPLRGTVRTGSRKKPQIGETSEGRAIVAARAEEKLALLIKILYQ